MMERREYMDHSTVPKHIAIIPDGNRRWAKAHGLDPWKGHDEGVKRFEEISEAALLHGIDYLTFWAASEDNLKGRSKVEVSALVWLLERGLADEKALARFKKDGVRVRVLGRWREIIDKPSLNQAIEHVQSITSENTKANVTILLGYDGQSEMVAALNHLALTKQAVDAATLRAALWTADLPAVDLVIRTGGEPHWSAGFMMWHVANSQLYFTDKLWPEFTTKEFDLALEDYKGRQRRFGK
jgi:undecaprenyl diphosphate synthase